MRGIAILLAGLLGASLPATPALATSRDDAAVEREARARRHALFPAAHEEELRAVLRAPGWPERAAAFDALARGLESGGELLALHHEAIAAGLDDPHPTVREFALRTLAAAGSFGTLDATVALRLAADPLPAVRIELARALGAGPRLSREDAGGEILAELARAPDPRVADAARAALFEGGEERHPLRLALLREQFATGGDEELLTSFLRLARRSPSPRLLDALREDFARAGVDQRRRRAWRAVVEALAFAGRGDGDPDRLLEGWLGTGVRSPRRQRLLQSVAESRPAPLGEALVAAIDALESAEDSTRWPGLFADRRETIEAEGEEAVAHLPLELAELAVRCLEPGRLHELLFEASIHDATRVRLLDALGGSGAVWPTEAAWWLVPQVAPEVRSAAIHAFADTFSVTGDTYAGMLLAQALRDPDPALSSLAWRTLAASEAGEAWHRELVEAWRGLPLREALSRLDRVPRDRPFLPFREELLRLGEFADERRRVAAELLAPWRGDEEVRRALEEWLREELDVRGEAMRRGDGAAAEQGELRIGALVQALGQVTPAASADAIEAALAHAIGTSPDIGKIAVATLGLTPEGRVRLPRYLGPEIDRRIRIEAAIVGARHPRERDPAAARAVLIDDYGAATWDLASRMIAALGRGEDDASLAFLVTLARDGAEEERGAALAAIARRGDDAARRCLRDTVREANSFDARTLAVELLGEGGGAETAAFLDETLDALRRGELGAGWSGEQRRLVRSRLLAALAATGAFPEAREREWLVAPLAAASPSLLRRFRGEDLASAHFAWKGELELARAFAASGRADAALAGVEEWWRLDGRLLVALAEWTTEGRREDPPAAAHAFLRAGVTALLGEPVKNARRIGVARLRLLESSWREREWEGFERLASAVVRDRRGGVLTDATWRLAAGEEHLLRLECAIEQARAWGALERGERDRARVRIAQARAMVENSNRAAREQARLEAAFATGETGDREKGRDSSGTRPVDGER